MENRYENLVLKVNNPNIISGLNFKEGRSFYRLFKMAGSNTIESLPYTPSLSDNTFEKCESFKRPPLPANYIHVHGTALTGYVIERKTDGFQWVWCPINSLPPNGYIQGNYCFDKLGVRYGFSVESLWEYYIKTCKFGLSDELIALINSVKKYGGVYISRYPLSMEAYKKMQSKRALYPLILRSLKDAMQLASSIENTPYVKSCLTFDAVYDSCLAWIISSHPNVKKFMPNIIVNSKKIGNYWDSPYPYKKNTLNGINKRWCFNQIYDLAGNVRELTQAGLKENGNFYFLRGGSFLDYGEIRPVAYRKNCDFLDNLLGAGFRANLIIS